METPNRFLIAEKAISFPILHHYLVYHFVEKKSTLSGRKTTPSLYAIKFIKTSCNSFGIELTQMLFKGSYEEEDMVCRNEEITILREFQSRKESLKYLQKLPLEHKISLSKNLILNCIETFGDQQVYISFSGGKDSTVLSSLVCSLKPNILHLFSDTGCEYLETLSFVGAERHRGKNIVSVHPICRDGSIWTFERIVATYGYPYSPKQLLTEYGHTDTLKHQ